jgi:hypothetical protein
MMSGPQKEGENEMEMGKETQKEDAKDAEAQSR